MLEPSARAWSEHGILKFEGVFPLPPWDKNDRLVPNCIRREPAAEGGRLYFKPGVGLWKLGPKGVFYRATVAQLVRPALPRSPWFVKGIPWHLEFAQYGPGDVDHYLAGLLDDMCAAGLASSDRDCKRRVVDVHDEENTLLRRIEVIASQEIESA